MVDAHPMLPDRKVHAWLWRATVGSVVTAAAVAFGLMLGPVPAASAATGTVAELAQEFSTAATGSTITLTQSLVGTSADPGVAVPTGRSLILDLHGYTLTLIAAGSDAGLGVPAGAELTIMDSGTGGELHAAGNYTEPAGYSGAGIGSGDGEDAGTITINGGTVYATEGGYGAAIGGGMYGAGGTVIINGGAVNAASTRPGGGPAIGGGSGVGGAGAAVSIGSGASVTVSGGIAIGPGDPEESFGSLQNAGTLTIASGSISVPSAVTVVNTGTIVNVGTLSGAGTIQNSGAIVNTGTIDASVNVTAHNSTVTLDGNGGTAPVNPPTVYAASFTDGQVDFPADATRADYTFSGWYTQQTGGTVVNADTDLGADGPKTLTLFAHWAANQNTVTFDSQDGSTVPPVTVDNGSPVTEPAAPTRSGYAFSGWYAAATGGAAWDFNTPITGDTTLFAHWSGIAPVVPVDTNGVGAAAPTLAATGSDAAGWPWSALALILAGVGSLVVRSRRGETRRNDTL